MQWFDQSLMQWYKEGMISYESALFYATNPSEFALRVSGVDSSVGSEVQRDHRGQLGVRSLDLTP